MHAMHKLMHSHVSCTFIAPHRTRTLSCTRSCTNCLWYLASLLQSKGSSSWRCHLNICRRLVHTQSQAGWIYCSINHAVDRVHHLLFCWGQRGWVVLLQPSSSSRYWRIESNNRSCKIQLFIVSHFITYGRHKSPVIQNSNKLLRTRFFGRI